MHVWGSLTGVCECFGEAVSSGLCIYFQSKIYKLPSAVGCACLDYLHRENMAVKNSCVRGLCCVCLTSWSLAGWENRVGGSERWGHNEAEWDLEVVSDTVCPPPLALSAQQIRDSSQGSDTHTHIRLLYGSVALVFVLYICDFYLLAEQER